MHLGEKEWQVELPVRVERVCSIELLICEENDATNTAKAPAQSL